MEDKEAEPPGVTRLKDHIPPENIRLVGSFGLVDPDAKLGVSLSQDFESILPEIIPEYRWSTYRSTLNTKRCMTGVISLDKFTIDIQLELNPADSVKEIVKVWKLAATSFIMAPSKAIQIFDLDEPDEPVPPEEDIPREYQIMSIHIWPARSDIEAGIKIENESNLAAFLAEKASSDTQGRVLYRSIQLEESTCGDRRKLLSIARKIKQFTEEANPLTQ